MKQVWVVFLFIFYLDNNVYIIFFFFFPNPISVVCVQPASPNVRSSARSDVSASIYERRCVV